MSNSLLSLIYFQTVFLGNHDNLSRYYNDDVQWLKHLGAGYHNLLQVAKMGRKIRGRAKNCFEVRARNQVVVTMNELYHKSITNFGLPYFTIVVTVKIIKT